jgi:1-acyl-sn-glycerol-3-phosphate acyltransferase
MVGKYLRAGRNWGHVAARAAWYGTISCSLGGLPGGHPISQWCMRKWSAGCADALNIQRALRGAENLDLAPQAVLVANHLSSLDILVLGSYLKRDYRWLAKAPLFKVPFSGWHLKFAGHVPVYRGEQRGKNQDIAARIHAVVEEGASLLFFPEGTRSEDGQLKPFKIGAFMTAVQEGLPVLPLVVRGTHELMKKNAIDLEIRTDRACSVTVLPPVALPVGGDEKTRAEALRDATWRAMAAELTGPPGATPVAADAST